MKSYSLALVFLALFVFVPRAFAKGGDIPVQLRLFAGVNKVNPQDLNAELEAQGLKKISVVPQLGFEMVFPAFKYLDLGIRVGRRTIVRDEDPTSIVTDYEALLEQDTYLGLVRIPFFKTTVLRMDVFAGIGGVNTSVKFKTASQDGEIYDKGPQNWFGSAYTSSGGSIAIGYKKFFVVVEGGWESNTIDKLMRSGNVNNNVDTIDLSGSYVTVGLLFDGMSARKK